jgi:glycine/D-amino acid oxidase-like deaminating enzyme
MADSPPVPPAPEDVTADSDACATLLQLCGRAVPRLVDASQYRVTIREQACFLPTSADDVPVIGAVAGCPGVVIASGHSCWGILLAPATGLAVSQLVMDGECTAVDLRPFSPGRFASRRRRAK